MPELNDEDYPPLYQSQKIINTKKVLVMMKLLKNIPYDEDVSNTDYGIPYQDNNQL